MGNVTGNSGPVINGDVIRQDKDADGLFDGETKIGRGFDPVLDEERGTITFGQFELDAPFNPSMVLEYKGLKMSDCETGVRSYGHFEIKQGNVKCHLQK